MKKLLFLLPIVMLSLLMSSCKGDDGPMGPMGPAGTAGGAYYISGYTPEIKANQWEIYGDDYDDGTYIEYAFDVPELNGDVFEYGVVNTFVDKGDEKFQLNKTLPQYKANGDLDYFMYYDYSYVKGRIYFRISYSDNIVRLPNNELFYFVLQNKK